MPRQRLGATHSAVAAGTALAAAARSEAPRPTDETEHPADWLRGLMFTTALLFRASDATCVVAQGTERPRFRGLCPTGAAGLEPATPVLESDPGGREHFDLLALLVDDLDPVRPRGRPARAAAEEPRRGPVVWRRAAGRRRRGLPEAPRPFRHTNAHDASPTRVLGGPSNATTAAIAASIFLGESGWSLPMIAPYGLSLTAQWPMSAGWSRPQLRPPRSTRYVRPER